MTSTDSETAFVQPPRMLRPQEAAKTPTSPDWLARVQERLRTEVGEDVYSSWFTRMELDGIEGETLKLSVPTRFLKSWIQSHYTEKVLACCQAERPEILRIELTVRSAVIRTLALKLKAAPTPTRAEAPEIKFLSDDHRSAVAPILASHEALGGSPLDPRLTFDSFIVGRSNTLAHAAAKQVAQARRGEPVMFNPLYIRAGVGLGKTHLLQSLPGPAMPAPSAKCFISRRKNSCMASSPRSARRQHSRSRMRCAGSTCW